VELSTTELKSFLFPGPPQYLGMSLEKVVAKVSTYLAIISTTAVGI